MIIKKLSLGLLSSALLLTTSATPALAENWTLTGSNIYNNNSGNVGIGINNPTTKFQVNTGVNTEAIRLSNGTTPVATLWNSDGTNNAGWLFLFSQGSMTTQIAGSAGYPTFFNAGNVGIGLINPAGKLDINGTSITAYGAGYEGRVSGGAYGGVGLGGFYPFKTAVGGNDTVVRYAAGGNNFVLQHGTTNVLVADQNDRIGIGTTSPGQKLDVVGGAIRTNNQLISTVITGTAPLAVSSTTKVTNLNADTLDGLDSTGLCQTNGTGCPGSSANGWTDVSANVYLTSGADRVGIGTTAPAATLEVKRGTAFDGTAAFWGTNYNSHFNYSTAEDTYIRGGKAGSKVYLNDNHNGSVILTNGGGNVGIGTETPSEKLEVAGNIKATGIRGSDPIWVKVHNSINQQTSSSGTWWPLSFNTEDEDLYAMHTSGSPTFLTLTSIPGVYRISCSLSFSANAIGVRGVQIYNASTGIVAAETVVPAAGNSLNTSISASADLRVTGTTQYVCKAMSNGVVVDVVYLSGYSPYFTATRLP